MIHNKCFISQSPLFSFSSFLPSSVFVVLFCFSKQSHLAWNSLIGPCLAGWPASRDLHVSTSFILQLQMYATVPNIWWGGSCKQDLTMFPWLSRSSLCRPGWPLTHRAALGSASPVLEIKVCLQAWLYPACLFGFWEPNSGPSACTKTTLVAELSSQLTRQCWKPLTSLDTTQQVVQLFCPAVAFEAQVWKLGRTYLHLSSVSSTSPHLELTFLNLILEEEDLIVLIHNNDIIYINDNI